MLASLTAIVVASSDGLASDYASWEVAAAGPADCVILADSLLAVAPWTFDPLAWGLLGRVLGEDAHSYLHVSLSLLLVSHSLQLHKCP